MTLRNSLYYRHRHPRSNPALKKKPSCSLSFSPKPYPRSESDVRPGVPGTLPDGDGIGHLCLTPPPPRPMVAATPTEALEIRRASRGVHSPLPPPHPPLPAPPPLVVAPVFFLPLPQKEGQHVPALMKAMGRQPKRYHNDNDIPGKGSNIPNRAE